MSRRAKPEEEMPPIYSNIINESTINKVNNDIMVVPELILFGNELKGMKEKISNIKMCNLQSNFIEKVKTVLDLFDKEIINIQTVYCIL